MHPRLIAFFVALVLLCTGAAAHVEPLLLPAGDAGSMACSLASWVNGSLANDADAGSGQQADADGGRTLPQPAIDGLGDGPGVLPAQPRPWPSVLPRAEWSSARAAHIPLPPYLDGLQRPPC